MAEPESVIKHGVDLKGYFDEEQIPVSLSGPEVISKSVTITKPGLADSIAPAQPPAYLTWYRLTKVEPEEHGQLTLTDSLRGENPYTVNVKSPAYLLSPAQTLIDGPPAEVPEDLNLFKAYAIEQAEPLDEKIRIEDSLVSGDRTVLRPAFLCLPTEEWHHEEYSGIKSPGNWFVVYALEPVEIDERATTMDQFGIHRLKLTSSSWLCVSAQPDKTATGQ